MTVMAYSFGPSRNFSDMRQELRPQPGNATTLERPPQSQARRPS